MSASPKPFVNPCDCTGPGWCERHQVQKSQHLVDLCRTSEDYFKAWEQKRGPGQLGLDTPRPGLGDMVAATLKATGITSALGLEGCGGCARRQELLNTLGKKIGIGGP